MNCLPSYEEAGTGTSTGIKAKSEKESCWQCYKLFPKEKGVCKYNKVKCSEVRLSVERSAMRNMRRRIRSHVRTRLGTARRRF